ncbi:UNVERIFIED_ORG: TetR family transcriptional regulator [Bacillus sp. AZ43]
MQERAVQTRQTLISAAAEVFAQRGFAAATMSDILEAAGVTKGALYFHFRSKEELAHAIFTEDRRYADVDTASDAGPLQELIDLSHQFARALQTDPVARASVRLAIELTFVEGEEPAGYGTWQHTVTTLLERAAEHGELAEGVQPEAAANVIVGSFTGLQLLSEARSDRVDLHTTLVDWWRILVLGLASPEAVGRLVPEGTARPADSTPVATG